MLLKIEDIPESGLHLQETPAGEFLNAILPQGQDLVAEQAVAVDLRFEKLGGRVSVKGNAKTIVNGVCALCAQPMTFKLATEVNLVLFNTIKGRGDEEKADQDAREQLSENTDVGMGSFDGKHIDWGELVREQLLLSLPIAPRCKENCLGLCTICGVDRNLTMCQCAEEKIDPRWEKLRLIKNEMGQKPS